jgi:hypothetical protein
MSKKISFKQKDVCRPPKGARWVWHTADMRTTEKWRKMSLMCHRLLERIELENMAHNGLENGRLKIAYSQFEAWGISRRSISAAIKEAINGGFLEVKQGYHLKDTPNEYRLTYLWTRERIATGAHEYSAPTNEWKWRAGKSFFIGQNVTLTVGQKVTLTAGAKTPKTAETLEGEVGQNVTHTSILSGSSPGRAAPASALPGVSTPGTVVSSPPPSTNQTPLPQRPSSRRISR